MLKTVQQHLRELDRERLIDAYLYRVRHDILDCYRDEESNNYRRTIREIRRDHEEFIGEYEYTQQNIYELMVDVMYEASWFGFADEGKEDFVDDLQDQIDQLQAGTLETCPVDDIFPDWFKEMKRLEEEHKIEEAAERSEVKHDEEEELDAQSVCEEALKLVGDYNDRANRRQKRLIQRRLLLARAIGLIQTRLSMEE